MELPEWLSITIAVITLILSGVAVWYARRSTQLAAERSVVDWAVSKGPKDGLFEAQNIGLDTAHDVVIEAWDSHEARRVDCKRPVSPDQSVRFGLVHRNQHGADPVQDFRFPRPRVSDSPPSASTTSPHQFVRASADAEWKVLKEAQDAADAIFEQHKREMEATQVHVRITWRSKRGAWTSFETTTG